MQQLHFVGLTTDHTGLILSARRGAKTGKFSVSADDKLLTALQEAQRRRNGEEPSDGAESTQETPAPPPDPAPQPAAPPKPVSSLSPREIQARLRAGGTVSEIALAAGVDQEWILRFADPIRAEQARVVSGAQSLTFNKPRLGLSAETLETSVLLNLADRGVRLPADVFAAAWRGYNLHGTSWAVVFSYVSRQRRQSAQWEVDLRSGELVARNRLASDLAYLEPGRRRRRLEPLEPVSEEEPVQPRRSPPKKRAAAKKASTPKRAAPSTSKVAAAKRTAAKKTTAGKKAPAATKKTAAVRKTAAVKKAAAIKKAPAGKKVSAAKKAPAAKKGGSRQSSPRGRRPAKKPAAKKPAPPIIVTAPPAAALPERPTHLARPPSPMNQTNRAVTLPGRLVGAPSLRPPLPPPSRARASAVRPSRPQERAPALERQAPPDAEPTSPQFAPEPAPQPAPPAPEPTPAAEGEEPRGRGRRRRSERVIAPKAGDKPAVVILSTPAVRRLESDDKRGSKASAPPS